MISSNFPALSLRAYSAASERHCHDFAQLVLPLRGSLSIDISGREALLDRGLAAYVDRGAPHEQESTLTNQFLIMDFDPRDFDPRLAERLATRPFIPLTSEANNLIDYMGTSLAKGVVPPSRIQLWIPLLLDSLMGEEPQPRSRLAGLLALMEADPFFDWTPAHMAAKSGLSISRLHALFRQELNTTPGMWLSNLRLSRVCNWLTSTNLPIAELAYRDLLSIVYRRLAEEWGIPVSWSECVAYGQTVKDWPAFTDSASALQYLKRHYKLVILSNVDNESFSASNEKLQTEFDAIYTAEDIGSYKPSDRNFEYMLKKLETLGIQKHEILHTAESMFHDHGPANRHSVASCWIYRRYDQDGFGATMHPGEMPKYNFRFNSMAEFAEAHREEIARG